MEYIIILLWALGAWAEAVSFTHNNELYGGTTNISSGDAALILIWPLTSLAIGLIILGTAVHDATSYRSLS